MPIRPDLDPQMQGWCDRNYSRPLSPAERVLIEVVCKALRTGPHNVVSGSEQKRLQPIGDGSFAARLTVSTHWMATVDGDGLTRLIFAAHDYCARVAIQPAGRLLAIVLHLRDRREGSNAERHPTLEDAVASWRERYPVSGEVANAAR